MSEEINDYEEDKESAASRRKQKVQEAPGLFSC